MASPDSLSGQRPKRARRSRTQFDPSAISRLESFFAVERYPDINLREKLAREIGVSEARIQTWFQNKRSRSRKSSGSKNEMAPQDNGANFKCEQAKLETSSPAKKNARNTTVTDSDIEEMREVDPDASSDGELSSAFRRVAVPRRDTMNVPLPSYLPSLPMFMQDLYGSYLQQHNHSDFSGYHSSTSRITDFNSASSQMYAQQFSSSASWTPYLTSASTPLRHYVPLTPTMTPTSLTPSSLTSSPASSPYCSPQQFVYPPTGAQQSLPPAHGDTSRNIKETQQMEPLDLSVTQPSAHDEELYIDVCG